MSFPNLPNYSHDLCHCGDACASKVSAGGKRPGTPFFNCADDQCSYFRWADWPRARCVCGLAITMRQTDEGVFYFLCRSNKEPRGCNFRHYFNPGKPQWAPTWTAESVAATNTNTAKRRHSDDEATGGSRDIRHMTRPVPSLVDEMISTTLPVPRVAAAVKCHDAVLPASEDGQRSLQALVLVLAQDVAALRETVKRLESTKKSRDC